MIKTRILELSREPCVLLSQYEQVFYLEVPIKVGWSYVVRNDQRGRLITFTIHKEDDIEEDQQDRVEE